MEVVHTIGRRKTSVARVYLAEGKGNVTVNNKNYKDFFASAVQHDKVDQAFNITNTTGKFDIKATIKGGGTTGQVEALRLAISRALVKVDPEYKPALKAEGLMTRDPRMVERKKPGQKKARKKFQFSKR